MEIFPIMQPNAYQLDEWTDENDYDYIDIAWDVTNNCPIFHDGNPVWAHGLEALIGWMHRAIQTERARHEIFSLDYGCDIYTLIGHGYADDVIVAETERYITECLLVNPYIQNVSNVSVQFDDILHISCIVSTYFGEGTLNV